MSNFDDFMIGEATQKNQQISDLLSAKQSLERRVQELGNCLLVILDNVDYTDGACRVNEMVGAVLPKELIDKARSALKVK